MNAPAATPAGSTASVGASGQSRPLWRRLTGRRVSDGGGVRLNRLLPSAGPGAVDTDPFLLLDAFHSDRADDYLAGFPPHPHRGFETLTYLFAGRMQHRDNSGHAGLVEAGGLQWMSAGSGIVHEEMPQQTDGLLSGLQLWVNLPAGKKMTAPRYQEFGPAEVPLERRADGVEVRVLAGRTEAGSRGPVDRSAALGVYFDAQVPAGAVYAEPLASQQTALVYLAAGSVRLPAADQPLAAGQLAVLGRGDGLRVVAEADSRLLLMAGTPIREPVVRGGPFVMNSAAEIEQAYRDYRDGGFGDLEGPSDAVG